MGDPHDAYLACYMVLFGIYFLYEDWNLYPVYVCVCVCAEKPLELLCKVMDNLQT